MALVLADRVLETSTSEGLGTFALAGAQTGYQTFSSGIGNGNTCYYTINGQTTEQWEVGIGTVDAGTLARTTLISSNTGSFINFVAGVKNVFVTQPASKSIYKDASGNAIPLGSASATQLDITAQGNLRLQDTTGGEYVGIQAPAILAASYTLTMPVDDGTSGQALITDGSGVLSWSTSASGDVYGPASATDNAIARFDLTTGKLIQNSVVTIADDGATVIAVNSASDGLRITQIGAGNALVVEDSANPDATPFVINNSGTIGQGTTSPTTTSFTGGMVSTSSTAFAPQLVFQNTTADANGAYYILEKSRAGAIVSSGDATGAVVFRGYDGANYISAALITAAVDGTPGTNDMPGRLVFSTTADGASSSTERMRIDSAGNVGIGAASVAGYSVRSAKNVTGAVTTYGIAQQGTVQSDNTTAHNAFLSNPSTQATAFTLTGLRHFYAAPGTFGVGSAVTNQFGFHAESSLNGATNNYGFYGNIASGTGRFNFYAAGTAANVFVGTTSIGGAVGSESLRVTPVASAVNYWNVFGSATGNAISLLTSGSDTNIGVSFLTKGTGNYNFYTGTTSGFTGAVAQFIVSHTASAVNYLQVTGAATAGAPVLSAAGSDTNIDLALTPKGTGVLAFGTHTAGILAQSGYITIKDAGGTTRNLLVG